MFINGQDGYFYENEIVDGTSILNVNPETLAEYKKHIGDEDSDDESVLIQGGFMNDGNLTVAGALIFGQKMAFEFPQSKLKFIKYDGIKKDIEGRFDVIVDMEFTGNLPFLIQEGYRSIRLQLREQDNLFSETQLVTASKYPEYLWVEGIVNALMHRDYSLTNDFVRVEMYDDQLEIFSPGGLPDGVTIENMHHTKNAQNPLVTKSLKKFNFMRKLNESMSRIFDDRTAEESKRFEITEPYGSSVMLRLPNTDFFEEDKL